MFNLFKKKKPNKPVVCKALADDLKRSGFNADWLIKANYRYSLQSSLFFWGHFSEIIEIIKTYDETTQMVIGHGLNMSSSLFYQNFKSVDRFGELSENKKADFLSKMINFREKLQHKDQFAAVGVNIFIYWLESIIIENIDSDKIQKELIWISKKGLPLDPSYSER